MGDVVRIRRLNWHAEELLPGPAQVAANDANAALWRLLNWRWLPLLVFVATAVFGTLFFRLDWARPLVPTAPAAHPPTFVECRHKGQEDCVLDGDTFRIGGMTVRIADIDTPEVFGPRCAAEKALGDRATLRLMGLLNAGRFELLPIDRTVDRYGRQLRVVMRDGQSLGLRLVSEGLARRWDGTRHPWC